MDDYVLFFVIVLGMVLSVLYTHGAIRARRVDRMAKRQTLNEPTA